MARYAAACCQSYRSPGETPAHPARLSVSGSAVKDIPLCSIGSLPSSPFTPRLLHISAHPAGEPPSRRQWSSPRRARRPPYSGRYQRLSGVHWQSALSGFRRHRIAVCYIYRQSYRRSDGMMCKPVYTYQRFFRRSKNHKDVHRSQTKKPNATKRHISRKIQLNVAYFTGLSARVK
jgi:hypothetical protein